MELSATVAAVKDAVSGLGGAFMTSKRTFAVGEELGVPGWDFYVTGRGGVLGAVDADVVAAAFVYFPRAWVREHWERATAVVPPSEGARRYAAACASWGAYRLGGFDGAARLAELAARVADAADAAGSPLFAGWRALPRPDAPAERAAHLLNVLREHRGGCHAVAVLAAGLTPLEAIVSGPYGPGNAAFFGWPEPYPDPAPLAAAHADAEATTDRLAAPAYATLSADERAELVELLTAAGAAAFPPR